MDNSTLRYHNGGGNQVSLGWSPDPEVFPTIHRWKYCPDHTRLAMRVAGLGHAKEAVWGGNVADAMAALLPGTAL